jgi:hypothetical protein
MATIVELEEPDSNEVIQSSKAKAADRLRNAVLMQTMRCGLHYLLVKYSGGGG